jgi:hypothetical protein
LGQKELSELADKLLNDSQLRARFTRDPEAAAAEAGINLDDDDRAALRNLGVHDMDEAELVARVSKRDASSARSA